MLESVNLALVTSSIQKRPVSPSVSLDSVFPKISVKIDTPIKKCFNFERHGSCRWGDDCRYRHPIMVGNNRIPANSNFLGQGRNQRNRRIDQTNDRENQNWKSRTNLPQGWKSQDRAFGQNQSHHISSLSPENIKYHDLRGSRW